MGNQLKILYVAYPLLTVSETSAGGAEQVLWTLEREMTGRGVATTVAASAGSRVSGELFSTGEPCSSTDDFQRRNREHQKAIIELVRQRTREGRPFDLVHDMSGSFWTRAAEIEVPVLATLHLPRHFYQATQLENVPENVSFNCVSESQARSFSDIKQLAGVVPNGIALDRFLPGHGERNGLLWLGRICEEKGVHLAIEVARRTGLPLVIAGQVYPFSYHQDYFRREVFPHLDGTSVRWEESPKLEVKLELLSRARALLIPTLADETSSLVAMEAAACGTPVVAFRRGAIHEVIEDGKTGSLVQTVDEMVAAVKNIGQLDPYVCRHYIEEKYSATAMADGYERLYQSAVASASSQVVTS